MTSSPERLRAIRGATTVARDSSDAIGCRTGELLTEVIARNEIATAEIVSVILTATPDLVADFPAVAARSIGLSQTPLLCCQEIPVIGAVERCVRILMHVYLPAAQPIHHVYLHGARQLRLDLSE